MNQIPESVTISGKLLFWLIGGLSLAVIMIIVLSILLLLLYNTILYTPDLKDMRIKKLLEKKEIHELKRKIKQESAKNRSNTVGKDFSNTKIMDVDFHDV